jgi:hypothetical protein
LKFLQSKFVKYTGIQFSHPSDPKKLISYSKEFPKLDPIVKEFSDGTFRSYICLLYAQCENPFGKPWVVGIFAAEELFWFPYFFQLPKYFLIARQKNDLRLKVRLIKSLAVNDQEKILDLQECLKRLRVSNKKRTQLKQMIIEAIYHKINNQLIQPQFKII